MHTGRPLAVALCIALSFTLAACGGSRGAIATDAFLDAVVLAADLLFFLDR